MFDLNEVNINLSRRGFISCVVPDAATALEKSLEIIGRDSVGIGGSLTVKELGLAERLREAGNAVYWHWTDGPLAKNGAEPNAFTANAMTGYYFDSTEHFEENLEILLSFCVQITA